MWAKLWMLAGIAAFISWFVVCQESAQAQLLANQSATISQVTLSGTSTYQGIPVRELSGLAWDADEQQLIAVSDYGYVYRFRLHRQRDRLVEVTPIFAARLTNTATDAGGSKSHKRINAEGVALHARELVIAEENPATLGRFRLDGQHLGNMSVPEPANDISRYKKKGRGLESVIWHPQFGVITAPESPLRKTPKNLHTVYAKGYVWAFPHFGPRSRLKGMALFPDGKLLVLERTRLGNKSTQVASLRQVDLGKCDASDVCEATLLTTLPPGAENFEGLALLDAHSALIVSDNGGNSNTDTTFALIVLP